jgi:hypothetical protein
VAEYVSEITRLRECYFHLIKFIVTAECLVVNVACGGLANLTGMKLPVNKKGRI